MARTILEIAQEASERETTAPTPSTLFGSNDRIAKILRIAMKDTMRDIMRRTSWLGLSDLHSTWVMVLEPGKFSYELPPDFLRMIENTENRGGWPMGLIGPVTPEVWASWLSGASAIVAPMGWRIRNGAIWFEPTPASAELVTIEYISSYPVVSTIQPGDYDTSIPPNAVSPVVPRDGFIDADASEIVYDATGTEFAYGTAPGWDAAVWTAELSDILKRINPLSIVAPAPQVRRPEFTADTDMPAFEDDYVLSLGMTMRLRRALGLPYSAQLDEYEAEIESRAFDDAGGVRAFRIGATDEECDVLPLGGGKWLVG